MRFLRSNNQPNSIFTEENSPFFPFFSHNYFFTEFVYSIRSDRFHSHFFKPRQISRIYTNLSYMRIIDISIETLQCCNIIVLHVLPASYNTSSWVLSQHRRFSIMQHVILHDACVPLLPELFTGSCVFSQSH